MHILLHSTPTDAYTTAVCGLARFYKMSTYNYRQMIQAHPVCLHFYSADLIANMLFRSKLNLKLDKLFVEQVLE